MADTTSIQQIEAVSGTPIDTSSIETSSVPQTESAMDDNVAANVESEGATDVVTPSDTPQTAPSTSTQRPRKPKRPNLHERYTELVPLRTYPLPPFIANNPHSIYPIIAAFLYQLFLPPRSHPDPQYYGFFSPSLRSIHVTDPRSIQGLWERGFFGKGSLSRSDPSWIEREKARLGAGGQKTSEDVTAARREERKKEKWKRAREQQEAIERQRKLEFHEDHEINIDTSDKLGQPTPAEVYGGPDHPDVKKRSVQMELAEGKDLEEAKAAMAAADAERDDVAKPTAEVVDITRPEADDKDATPPKIEEKEHLNLTTTEAFYLCYALGALTLYHPSAGASPSSFSTPYTNRELWDVFRRTSHIPPLPPHIRTRPDDPFLIDYVVYHHFRSLGYTVRHGVKFGVDFMLYRQGPPFDHAEFVVIIMPNYSDEYWKSEESTVEYPGGRRMYVEGQLRRRNKWSWVSAVNRVNGQARKTLVVVYVDVPRPLEKEEEERVGVEGVLRRYKVREIVLKRWVSNRARD